MGGKVWIIDLEGLDHSKEIEIYKENNVDFVFSSKETYDKDFNRMMSEATVIVVEASVAIDETVINQLEKCKAILSFGTGFDNIDVQAAYRRNIAVCNLPDYCSDEVADHTLSLILSLLRRIPNYNADLKSGKWNSISAKPLHRFQDTVIGLLGFGRIAQKVAERLKPFGFTIIAYDEYVDENIFSNKGVTAVSLDKVLSESNLLSLHVPLTQETENLLNEETMRKLPKDAMVVNTCRGGIIDETSLVKLIDEGGLSGAAIDVFLSEPPNLANDIFQRDDIITTPHAAYYSIESIEEMQTRTAENALRVLQDKDPLYQVEVR